MRYLLDTHAFIWLLDSSPKFPLKTKKLIISPENTICLSSASLWEIAIKVGLQKLKLSQTYEKVLDYLDRTSIEVLQIEHDYLKQLAALPNIHKDPFDRLLIATALAEDLVIITADENIHKYETPWIW